MGMRADCHRHFSQLGAARRAEGLTVADFDVACGQKCELPPFCGEVVFEVRRHGPVRILWGWQWRWSSAVAGCCAYAADPGEDLAAGLVACRESALVDEFSLPEPTIPEPSEQDSPSEYFAVTAASKYSYAIGTDQDHRLLG